MKAQLVVGYLPIKRHGSQGIYLLACGHTRKAIIKWPFTQTYRKCSKCQEKLPPEYETIWPFKKIGLAKAKGEGP